VFRLHEGTPPGKVRSVYYLGDFKVDAEHREQLNALIARFRSQKGRVKKLVVPGVDPNLVRTGPETIEDTGHTMPAADSRHGWCAGRSWEGVTGMTTRHER
jgi:hypothetical protein